MLTASSIFPINALTKALPHNRRMSGLSYIVLANFSNIGSGADTENSLYPWLDKRDGMAAAERPSVGEVRKYDRVSCDAPTVGNYDLGPQDR